jgi:hypothetical protein
VGEVYANTQGADAPDGEDKERHAPRSEVLIHCGSRSIPWGGFESTLGLRASEEGFGMLQPAPGVSRIHPIESFALAVI